MPTVTFQFPSSLPVYAYVDPTGANTGAKDDFSWEIPSANGSVLKLIGSFDTMAGTGPISGFEIRQGMNPPFITSSSDLNSKNLTTFLGLLTGSNLPPGAVAGAASAMAYLLDAAETYNGSSGNNVIDGFGGDDDVFAGSGDDIITSGAGSDDAYGGDGNDTFIFAAGDVTGSEHFDGGGGVDTALFNGSNNLYSAYHFYDIERIQFGAAATLTLNENIEDGLTFIGGAGENVLVFKAQSQFATVRDLSSHTFLSWESSDKVIIEGTANADVIRGTKAGALFNGGLGDDVLVGGSGADSFLGGAGVDILIGGRGNDTYWFDAADQISEFAGGGNDTYLVAGTFSLASLSQIENLALANVAGKTFAKLTGNALANTLTGDAGANTLAGGLGKDVLDGKAGKDSFVFNTALSKTANVDTIKAYSVKDDTVRLENKVFKALKKTGKLDSDMFHKGKAAADAEDRVIYDSKTGAVYYDPDGVGGAAQIKFAVLSKKLSLTHNDFVVI